ncbi:hypothetical protein C7M84_002616 [Penaeus vannamei]|uniref:Uncharacterized protein n=1 Tax=Penaeus vannamei TaxID=6689 RepID=A0A3R7QH30_PENVA|nr:hypothetical protein C7M84_002616 [Penaeus vannamei]
MEHIVGKGICSSQPSPLDLIARHIPLAQNTSLSSLSSSSPASLLCICTSLPASSSLPESSLKFMKVTFRKCSLSQEEVSELVSGIKSQGVKIVDELRIFSSSLGSLSADLTTLVKSELGCRLTLLDPKDGYEY